MTTTTYADICIERAQNIFTSQHPLELDLKDDSLSSDVCELARRLKKACEAIRQVANVFDAQSGYDKSNLYGNLLVNLADSLERMPE